MTNSTSPLMWDHTGHSIRSEPANAPPRTVRGNGWCYNCNVPIEAIWTVDSGVKPVPGPEKG